MVISTLRLELFLGGYFFILLFGYPIIDSIFSYNEIKFMIAEAKDYYIFILPNIIIFSYVIGIIVNGLGFGLTNNLFAKRMKLKHFKKGYNKEGNSNYYKTIKSQVFEKSPTYSISRLDFHHNNIRLIRSIMFNLIAALILMCFIGGNIYFILFNTISFIGLSIQLNNTSDTYYKDIIAAHKKIDIT